MYTLLKPLQVRKRLVAESLRIFTPEEFIRIFAIRRQAAKYFLEKQTNKGFLIRLKNGLYSLRDEIPPEEEIANKLYKPSYISFEYALAYFNIIPEMPYSVTSATTKPTRVFSVSDKLFNFFKIRKEAYWGYRLIKTADKAFLMAEPEKALVDFLYFVSLGKKTHNDRIDARNLERGKISEYARLYKRKCLNQIIERVYADGGKS